MAAPVIRVEHVGLEKRDEVFKMIRNQVRFVFALLLPFLAGLVPAQAQNLTFVPLGYCQLTSLATSTLISTCSGGIPKGATSAVIAVEGAAIRYRDDGTAPTASVGMPIASGQAFQYSSTLSGLRIIEQSESASVSILFYR